MRHNRKHHTDGVGNMTGPHLHWTQKRGADPASSSEAAILGENMTRTVQKTYGAAFDVPTDTTTHQPGYFKALVSVFGNTDSYGDIVVRGAFAKSLAEWQEKNTPIPVVWSHDFRDVDSIIGEYLGMKETEKGLEVEGQLDLDHPRAARIYTLMQRGLITEFSWSGEVVTYELIKSEDPDDFWPGLKILDVDLWEAGPCFKGANPDTTLIEIKNREAQKRKSRATSEPTPDTTNTPEHGGSGSEKSTSILGLLRIHANGTGH